MQNTFLKIRKHAGNFATYALLVALGVLWILPIVYLVYTAFRVTPNTGIINTLFPEDLQLGFGNFSRLFRDTMFLRWLGNTLLVATCSCALTTLFILAVSYALSRLRFKMRKLIMNILLVLGMFPGFMSMIAVYFILSSPAPSSVMPFWARTPRSCATASWAACSAPTRRRISASPPRVQWSIPSCFPAR